MSLFAHKLINGNWLKSQVSQPIKSWYFILASFHDCYLEVAACKQQYKFHASNNINFMQATI